MTVGSDCVGKLGWTILKIVVAYVFASFANESRCSNPDLRLDPFDIMKKSCEDILAVLEVDELDVDVYA